MIINIAFSVIMVILAIIDIKTTNKPYHKDFKSIILTLGVLGTFIGVFIGLLGFNINNIETSISILLDGLKIAFYTSIVGMGIAILISIYQRFIGFKVDNKDSLDFITIQSKKLDNLDELPKINEMNLEHKEIFVELKEILNKSFELNSNLVTKMVESNNDNFKVLLDSNKNLNETLLNMQNSISKDLIKQINNLNSSTIKEIEKLSSDFSSDVICSVSNLSNEWTNNINVYFSENFKRFNKAVDNILDWQKEYKKTMIDSNEISKENSKTIKTMDNIVNNIIRRDEATIELYKEVSHIMKEYKSQNIILDEKLQTMQNLGDGAINSLKFMNTFFSDLNVYLKTTNENLISTTKNTIENIFISTIKEFESTNKNFIDSINKRDECFLKTIESSLKSIEDLNKNTLDSNKNITSSYQKLSKDLELSTKVISQNTSEMISDINKDGIKHLKNTTKIYFDDISDTQHKILNNMTNQITINQNLLDSNLTNLINAYLESLEKVTCSSIEASKELSVLNAQDIRKINDDISNFIKENSNSLSMSNLELINILEILQKQVEDSVRISKSMNENARDSINHIEESLQKMSDGFKNDYEWFLRRIKEIIGQRL